MDIALIAAALVALFVFPMVAYGVMWFTSRDGSKDRPEPPKPNQSEGTIPGKRN